MIPRLLFVTLMWLNALAWTGGRQAPVPRGDGKVDPDAPYGRRMPEGHYCKRPDVEIRPTETRAHHCTCEYKCTVDEQGNVEDHEDLKCLAACHENGQRCTCHPEGDPSVQCTTPGIAGAHYMNMDGKVIR